MAAAAAALAEPKQAVVATVIEAATIPQTSITIRNHRPGEVTVQFRRWTQYGLTAYQKGSFAGFTLAVAEDLERAGAAVIDPGVVRREPIANRMIRK